MCFMCFKTKFETLLAEIVLNVTCRQAKWQSCIDCICARDSKASCQGGGTEEMPNLHHKSVLEEEKPCFKSMLFLSELNFLVGIFPSFCHICIIVILLLYLVFLSKLFILPRWAVCIFMQLQTMSDSGDSSGTLLMLAVSTGLWTDINKSSTQQRVDANSFCHRSQVFMWTLWSTKVGSEKLGWWWWSTHHQCRVSAMKWMYFPQLNSTKPVVQEEHRR